MTSNKFAIPLLEDWLRRYYFTTSIDLGSSGVESFSFSEIRALTGITLDDLDSVVLQDSRTFGGDALRQAVATRWGNGDPQMTMVTHGSSEAIFLIMNALLRPGDEVIVLDPVYYQLLSVPLAIGCHVKRWTLLPEQDFVPDLDKLRKLVTSKTKMVILNFPHNPTGATITEAMLMEIIAICEQADAFLFWDAAFAELGYSSAPLPSPTKFYDKAIAVGTLSKAYGAPGLRVGWCIAAASVLDATVPLRDNLTLHLSPLVELLARRLIESADAIVASRLTQAKRNLATLDKWIRQNSNSVGWVAPRGGVSAFPQFKAVVNVEQFCAQLAEEDGVLLVPGTCFGYAHRVRLGYGGPSDAFEQGLRKIETKMQKGQY